MEKEFLRGRLIELDKGKKVTLAAYKDYFLQEHTDISHDTRRGYELALRLLCDSIGGSTLLNRVPKLLPKFVSHCRSRDTGLCMEGDDRGGI